MVAVNRLPPTLRLPTPFHGEVALLAVTPAPPTKAMADMGAARAKPIAMLLVSFENFIENLFG